MPEYIIYEHSMLVFCSCILSILNSNKKNNNNNKRHTGLEWHWKCSFFCEQILKHTMLWHYQLARNFRRFQCLCTVDLCNSKNINRFLALLPASEVNVLLKCSIEDFKVSASQQRSRVWFNVKAKLFIISTAVLQRFTCCMTGACVQLLTTAVGTWLR